MKNYFWNCLVAVILYLQYVFRDEAQIFCCDFWILKFLWFSKMRIYCDFLYPDPVVSLCSQCCPCSGAFLYQLSDLLEPRGPPWLQLPHLIMPQVWLVVTSSNLVCVNNIAKTGTNKTPHIKRNCLMCDLLFVHTESYCFTSSSWDIVNTICKLRLLKKSLA